MKIALLIPIIAILAIPFVLGAVPKDCFQNYTAISCGDQAYFDNAKYCSDVNLTIDDCYNENSSFTIIFSGIKYFEIPSEFSRVTFFMYSRSWSWLGDEADTPLPRGSRVYQLDEDTFKVVSQLNDTKIESVQITVPYCYNQVDSDREKVYPRTQYGKICSFETKETVPESTTSEIADVGKETTTVSSDSSSNWLIGILIAVILVVGLLLLWIKKKK